uniref:Odorant receptor n=1 Tax=Adelphocoris lineolatus TaxID=236346 RepID=A0A2I4PH40_ADELI|nr:olfactory receptor 51 [Adelphocoris lineolatus]
MKDHLILDDMGEVDIEWLTEEERALIISFDKVHSWTGMWRNAKRIQWSYFWLFQMTMFMIIYFYSLYFFLEELEILTHVIHHIIMAGDDFMYIYLLNYNRRNLEIVHDLNLKTYGYGSDLVKNYHRKLMTERLKTYRLVYRFILLSAAATILYLEAFFVLEATILKTYVTMYPIYLPIDLNHPVTYTSVVFLQHLQVYVTLVMGSGLVSILFSAWNHITLELAVLTFAMNNIEEIVKEQLSRFQFKSHGTKEAARNKIYRSCCYHLARHHGSIARYFNTFKSASRLTISCIFLTGIVCFACVGITTVTDNMGIKLKFFLIMVVQTSVIYAWCAVGQYISDQNANIQWVISGIPWWKMPKPCHSTLRLIMVGTSMPWFLTTPLGQDANNESFMDMVTSSYRIFNLVYQMMFSS